MTPRELSPDRRAGPTKLAAVATGGVRRIGPDERVPGAATPGMTREEALATGNMWAGFVRTEAGMVSGWHHHGEHHSVIYVLDGAMRMESGPGGAEVLDATPGDFLDVPPHVIHRESNPTDQEAHIVVFRAGTGPVVINLDGPESGSRTSP
jgi:uncharacterized RmlC-like cupin family protein